MGKAENTKGFILNKAREVFCNKGYITVTMKDICEITGLSRGGLYRHFSSTREIFIDQLDLHKVNSEKLLDSAIKSRVPAVNLFESFFKEQENEIMNIKNQINLAVYEFSIHEKDTNDLFKTRFDEGVRILTKLINYAKESGVVNVESSLSSAKHIIYTLEGLKMARSVFKLKSNDLFEQFEYIKSILGIDI